LCLGKKTIWILVAVTQLPDYLFFSLYDSSSPHLLVCCGWKTKLHTQSARKKGIRVSLVPNPLWATENREDAEFVVGYLALDI
jgi:hypothetical protein